MVFWFTSCLILITNLGRKRSWDSTFLLVSTVHVPVKCKLSFCFSTSDVEYEAKMPRYFSYELQVVHQSSMIPMYYMWTPITVRCVACVEDSQLSLRCMCKLHAINQPGLILSNVYTLSKKTKVHVARSKECIVKVRKISLIFESWIFISPFCCFLNWGLMLTCEHVLHGILGICFMGISI